MPIFAYEAINAQGQKETGELEAPNRNQAILEIRNGGLKPTKVAQRAETAANKANAKATKEAASGATPKKGKKGGRVSSQQLTDFTAQMAVLIDAGLPVVRSLKVLSKQQKPGGLKYVVPCGTIHLEVPHGLRVHRPAGRFQRPSNPSRLRCCAARDQTRGRAGTPGGRL